MLNSIRANDKAIISSLDKLSRNYKNLKEIIQIIQDKRKEYFSVTLKIFFANPLLFLFFAILLLCESIRKEQLCIIFVFVLYLHRYFFTNLVTEGDVTLCLILYLLLLFLSWQVYLLIIFANGQIDFLKSNQPIKKDRIHGPVFSLCKLYLLFAYTLILN